MARYPNGRIPESELVRLGVEHYATPATAQRLKNLIADVKANEGVTLRVTGGPNIYRNLKWQNFYWDVLPFPQAARPGTSSHGGEYQGRDAMAADIDNWAEIGKDKFYRYARKHGFTPGIFSWEPWHIVDFNPWVMPEVSGGGSDGSAKPKPPITPEEQEEDDMKPFMIWKKNANGTRQWALISGDLARMVPIYKLETANALGKLYGAATLVVESEWAGFVRASEIEVSLLDATEPA